MPYGRHKSRLDSDSFLEEFFCEVSGQEAYGANSTYGGVGIGGTSGSVFIPSPTQSPSPMEYDANDDGGGSTLKVAISRESGESDSFFSGGRDKRSTFPAVNVNPTPIPTVSALAAADPCALQWRQQPQNQRQQQQQQQQPQCLAQPPLPITARDHNPQRYNFNFSDTVDGCPIYDRSCVGGASRDVANSRTAAVTTAALATAAVESFPLIEPSTRSSPPPGICSDVAAPYATELGPRSCSKIENANVFMNLETAWPPGHAATGAASVAAAAATLAQAESDSCLGGNSKGMLVDISRSDPGEKITDASELSCRQIHYMLHQQHHQQLTSSAAQHRHLDPTANTTHGMPTSQQHQWQHEYQGHLTLADTLSQEVCDLNAVVGASLGTCADADDGLLSENWAGHDSFLGSVTGIGAGGDTDALVMGTDESVNIDALFAYTDHFGML